MVFVFGVFFVCLFCLFNADHITTDIELWLRVAARSSMTANYSSTLSSRSWTDGSEGEMVHEEYEVDYRDNGQERRRDPRSL